LTAALWLLVKLMLADVVLVGLLLALFLGLLRSKHASKGLVP
jgi:hypothetical protein